MSVTKTYARPKSAPTISTGIVLTVQAAEYPVTPVAFDEDGVGAVLDARLHCDANESGGTIDRDLFQIIATPTLNSNGSLVYTVVVTCILGDASSGTAHTLTVTHDQNMDTFQTAAGRARQ